MPDLIERLCQNPERFDLFQALHVLERSEPARRPVGTSLGLDEAVRLAGHTRLGFPASDIHAVRASQKSGPPLTLSSAVMALGGAQGPLPLAYTEMLLDAARRGEGAGLAFVDIFEQRLLGFLYRSRRKHRVALAAGDVQAAPPLRALDALSGLGRIEGARGPQGQRAWLRHAGLQGAAPRSVASLLALLRDRLGIAFTGRSFVGAWLPLAEEARARLAGAGSRGFGGCGMGRALGARAWDPGAGISLSTPPLRADVVAGLLPGGATHGLLAWLVSRHQQQDLRVQLQVAIADAPPTRLCTRGDAGAGLAPRLGLATWLCGPARARDAGAPAVTVQPPRFRVRA